MEVSWRGTNAFTIVFLLRSFSTSFTLWPNPTLPSPNEPYEMEVSRNNIANPINTVKASVPPASLKISESFSSFPKSLPNSSSIRRMSLTPFGFGFGAGSGRSNVFDPFSLELWDPFQGFPFDSFPLTHVPRFGGEASTLVAARVDWKETPEAHVFKADLPGLRKEEIKVEVDDGRVLQISGERNHEHEEKTETWHRVERSSGKFLRRFRLPENAKVDQVKAAMENGVLTVTVPKESAKKTSRKSIEISG